MNTEPLTVKNEAAPLALGVGLHYDIPAAAYHADPCATPSLSSGVARTILAKSLAHAHAEHPRLGGTAKKEETAAMNTGTLVHALVAGTTDNEIALGNFDTFRSKAAREWAEKMRALGAIPALECDMDAAKPIAAAIRAKAAAGITDNPFTAGRHEVTAVWEKHGAMFRARYDALVAPDGAPWTIWDWKVTSDISISEVKRKFRRFAYHLQAAHYLAGADALCPKFAGRHSFVFVFVEDAPPYSVRRYCLKSDTLIIAAMDISRAHSAWANALATDQWPDASRTETTHIDIPTFADEDESDTINTEVA